MAISIGAILNQWETIGVFDLLLPFLLVFAVVFGILSASKVLGENKVIHAIIALVLALLALRFNLFTDFLADVAPRLGIGLMVILAALILLGLFMPQNEDKRQKWFYGFAVLAGIIFLVIIWNSFNFFGWIGFGGYAMQDVIGFVIGLVIILGIIAGIVFSKSK